MVYRMQDALAPRSYGLGAPKAAKQTAQDKRDLRMAIQGAQDEWKKYIASLNNLINNLKRGYAPSDTPLPSPPATDGTLVANLQKQATRLLQVDLVKAQAVARNLDQVKGNRAASSAYAAGSPPVDVNGNPVDTSVPSGALPGSVQQVITDASGASPVLTQTTPGRGGGGGSPYTGAYQDPGSFQQMTTIPGSGGGSGGGGSSGLVKKIAVVVVVGLAAWLAYRWWSGRKR